MFPNSVVLTVVRRKQDHRICHRQRTRRPEGRHQPLSQSSQPGYICVIHGRSMSAGTLVAAVSYALLGCSYIVAQLADAYVVSKNAVD